MTNSLPEKLIILLEHAYTPEGLAFEALKNGDSAIADTLVESAQQADCEITLALVTIEESGSAEYDGYGQRWSEPDEDDFDIGEVFERTEMISNWRRPDGTALKMTSLPFSEEELCPEDIFEYLEPDDLEFHEATGNEGASFERTYRRAALVIWPKARNLAILNQAGHSVTLPFLEDLSQRWEADGSHFDSPLWQDAHTLAGYMIDTWSSSREYYSYRMRHNNNLADFLTYLYRLKDVAHIDRTLADICTAKNYHLDINTALLRASELLSLPRTLELLDLIISGNCKNDILACTQLLAAFANAGHMSAQTKQLAPAARTLLNNLPGDPERSVQERSWQQSSVSAELVVDLLNALSLIDSTLIKGAIDYLLNWPKTYPMDKVLVPSAVRLNQKNIPAPRLYQNVKNHLRTRIAQMIDPPSDEKRASKLSCQCNDCKALSLFLADPLKKDWHFKGVEAKRNHIEGIIQANQCDVNRTTNKKGRPYTLVCIKNQASYERRAKQHQQDLKNFEAFKI